MKIAFIFILLFVFIGCSDKPKIKEKVEGMKCGAGKCGANMFDANQALAKKKSNILKQLKKGDKRVDCIKNAKTTKILYDCIRNPKTKRLSIKCGTSIKQQEPKPVMKCAPGKCGGGM